MPWSILRDCQGRADEGYHYVPIRMLFTTSHCVFPERLTGEISWLLVCLAWLGSFSLHSRKLKMLYWNPIRHNPPEFPFPLIAGDQAISHSQRLHSLTPHSRLPCDFMGNVREPEIRLLSPWENQEAKGSRLYRRESIGYIWIRIRKK